MDNKRTVYLIAGPTAVGKSDIAYELAKKIDGEIINCDSVQLYKYMDIGSAKPDSEKMDMVKHHLYSIIEPDYYMTASTYQQLALACIDNVLARGKTPIVVGGTGLYLNSILYDMDFAGEKKDDGTRRKELEQMAEENGSEYMHQYLSAMHPESAERIHPNNTRKIIRAIEAFEEGDGIQPLDECPLNDKYDFRLYIINMDREELYKRINDRVDKLLEMGLLKEAEDLRNRGYSTSLSSMKAIGYKELFDYLDENIDFDTAVENIKKDTRHYAKRQTTWFKRYDFANNIEIKDDDTPAGVTRMIINAILESEE